MDWKRALIKQEQIFLKNLHWDPIHEQIGACFPILIIIIMKDCGIKGDDECEE